MTYNPTINSTLTFKEVETQSFTKTKKNTSPIFSKTSNILSYTHSENEFNDFAKEILLPYKQSTQGPFIAKGDINNDTLEDVFIGGAQGQAGQLFLQTSSGYCTKLW